MRLFTFVAFLGLCFSGCVVAAPTTTPDAPITSSKQAVYPDGTVFDKSDDGTKVTIVPGTTIVIKLEEDTKGKLIWGILENNKSIFEVVSNVSALVNGPGGKATQVRTITMKATKVGQSNLKIVYFPAGLQDYAGQTYTDTYRLYVNIVQQ